LVKNTAGTPDAAQRIVKTKIVARVSRQADRTIPRQVSSDRTIPRLETDSVGHNKQEARVAALIAAIARVGENTQAVRK
jgi:hypothetical protein